MISKNSLLKLYKPILLNRSLPSTSSLLTPSTSPFASSITRTYATGSVSNQPSSKNPKELISNAKEEIKTFGKGVGSVISGHTSTIGSISASDGHGLKKGSTGTFEEVKQDLNSLAAVAEKIPTGALLFGGAGLIPYAGTAFTSIYLSRAAGMADAGTPGYFDAETALALLHHVELIQIGYGAVILSFLGSVHCGLEFAGYNGFKNERYFVSLAPVVLGWGSLLIPAQAALITQTFAFLGMWFTDQRLCSMGWTPKWYSTYRFLLTTVVVSALFLTLGGSNYYVRGSNFSSRTASLEEKKSTEESAVNTLSVGDIKIESGDEAFVKFTNVEKVKEEERKEAEKKKEEERKARKEQRTGRSE